LEQSKRGKYLWLRRILHGLDFLLLQKTYTLMHKDPIREQHSIISLTSSYGSLNIHGEDRNTFLNSLVTNDVTIIHENSGQLNAILDRKSKIIATFWLFNAGSFFFLFCQNQFATIIQNHLENLIFSEDVQITSAKSQIFMLSGLNLYSFLESQTGQLADLQEGRYATNSYLDGEYVSLSLTGDECLIVFSDVNPMDKISGLQTLSEVDFQRLRLEAGILLHPQDFDDTTLLLELNKNHQIVNFDKGCYPGQESVSRIHFRGRIKQKLMGISFASKHSLEAGSELFIREKMVGIVKSGYFSPTLDKNIALVLLHHDYCLHGKKFQFIAGSEKVWCEIFRLPFYYSEVKTKRAVEHYQTGISSFHKNEFEVAKENFELSLEYNPDFADAWEALAILVEKEGKIDEALKLNKRFAELDPTAVMAHSNLSRLYMLKGLKDKAEEEQFKAAQLSGKTEATESDTAAKLERNKEIFLKVLQLDDKDEIANFGLGKISLEEMQFEKAVNHLQIVVSNNAEYSKAYELLGLAFMKSGQKNDAQKTFEKGIEVAEKKGEFMPAGDMKKHLELLMKV